MWKANKTINGSFGRLWVNEKLLANTKSFELKVKMDWENVTFPEELGEDYKYMGYSLSGTIVLSKMDSEMIHLYADGIQSGVLPEIRLVGRLADPAAFGAERIAVEDVVFDELTLMKFENKKIGEEEVPFKARAYRFLDMIPRGVI